MGKIYSPWIISFLCTLVLLLFVSPTQSFYLPGVAPRDFQRFVENSLLPVIRGLPLVLKQYEPMVKQLEKWGEKPLSFSRVNGLKSNKQGGDCGVYTLKYIDTLATKKTDISDIEDKLIDGYRSYLAHSIWNRKWDSP